MVKTRFLLLPVSLLIAQCVLSAQPGPPVLNPANGHYYQVFPSGSPGAIYWAPANAAAQTQTFNGVVGHLVTITSAAEQSFVINLVSPYTRGGTGTTTDSFWIGGTKQPGNPDPTAGWQWITGEPFVYTNWAPGEPNNAEGGTEGKIEMYNLNDAQNRFAPIGSWNDQPPYFTQPFTYGHGYIVEYDTCNSCPPFSLSGHIKQGSTGLANVVLTLSGAAPTSTDSSGNYTVSALNSGATYMVTPSFFGYGFSPPSQVVNGVSGNQIANFCASDNMSFVRQQYLDLLNREPDSGGWTFWTNSLNSGMTRNQIVGSFFTSPEFSQGGLTIVKYYIAVLGRDPDYSGWLSWFTQYINRAPLSTILNFFLNSPEFQNTYAPLANSDFVTVVYNNVLGRAPDATGLNFWVGQLNSGQSTRAQLMAAFIGSPEFGTFIRPRAYADLLYMGFLRRTPDQSGLTYWINSLADPNALGGATYSFINSPEYNARFSCVLP